MRMEAKRGTVTLYAELIRMGEDVLVGVYGGDKPHIGSVCLGIPHEGISDSAKDSATVSTINVPAHRDGQIGDQIAKQLSGALKRHVAVACGIHFDFFSEEILRDTREAAQALCRELQQCLEAEGNA